MIYRILILLVITACSAIAADGDKKEQEIGGKKAAAFTCHSLTPETADAVVALIVESNKTATNPQIVDPAGIVKNQLARIAAGNAYHLMAFCKGDVVQAAMIQGQMPKAGYKVGEHDRVIAIFAELLTVAKDPAPFGFSTMVPVFANDVDEGGRTEVYQTMMLLNKDLAKQGKTLPQASAGLLPCQLLVLLHPDHRDVDLLVALGFVNRGNYPEFYGAARLLLSYPLV